MILKLNRATTLLGALAGGIGGGSGFVYPNSADRPFATIAARDAWATANPDDLVDGTTVVLVDSVPQVWYLWTGDTTQWIDATPLVQGPAGDDGIDGTDMVFTDANDRDTFFQARPDLLRNGLPILLYAGGEVVTLELWAGATSPTAYDPATDAANWIVPTLEVGSGSLRMGSLEVSNGVQAVGLRYPDGQRAMVVAVEYDSTGSAVPFIYELGAESNLMINPADDQTLTAPFSLDYDTFGDNITTDFRFKPAEAGTLRATFRDRSIAGNPVIFDEIRAVTQDEVDSGAFIDFGVGNQYILDAARQLAVTFSGIRLRGGVVTSPTSPFTGQTVIAFESTVQPFTRRNIMLTNQFTGGAVVNLLEALTGNDRLDASAVRGLPTPRTDEQIRDVSYAGIRGINGISVTVDDDGDIVTISGNGAPPPTEQDEFYHGRSSSNNPATVDVATLTQNDVGIGSGQQFTFSITPATLNDYVILLVPAAHDLSSLVNTGTGFGVLSSFTRTANVRQINGDNYNSYTLGPLVAGFTADYRATLA